VNTRLLCRRVLVLPAVVVALAGCMEGFVATVNEVVVAENAPGGFPDPAAGSLISPDQEIRVR